MWKRLIELGGQLIALNRKVQQHDLDIKELQQSRQETQEALRALAGVVQQMQAEMRHDRDVAARDRENLLLRLENYLLCEERQLPPGPLLGELPPPQQLSEKKLYTEDEYFEFLETAEERWEFHPVGPLRADGSTRGRLRMMAGGTLDHATIAGNLIRVLGTALTPKGCRVFGSDMRIHTGDGFDLFPDVGVVCEAPAFHGGRKHTITNPVLLVEVLSPSTATYDIGEKFIHYQTVPSLADYLIVFQGQAQAVLHSRAGDHWATRLVYGRESAVHLPSVGVTLALADVFALIEFEAGAPPCEET